MTQERRRYYRTFGLVISSEIDLLEVEETAPAEPDVVLTLGAVDRPDPEMPWGAIHAFTPDEQYFGFAQVGKYLIRDASQVTYQRDETLPAHFAGYSFLGPVLAMLLHLRGYLILHGSALAVDGRAAVFLGDKGAGKSTTAGAMIAADHPLVTDDLVAIFFTADGTPMVQIGYPSIKVTPAALASYREGDFSLVCDELDGFPKRRARLNRPQPAAPVPMGRIFLLQRAAADTEPAIAPLALEQALPAVFEHSYMARYGRDAWPTPAALTTHLGQCGALLRAIGVSTLHVPDAIERLSQTVALVEADMRSAATGNG